MLGYRDGPEGTRGDLKGPRSATQNHLCTNNIRWRLITSFQIMGVEKFRIGNSLVSTYPLSVSNCPCLARNILQPQMRCYLLLINYCVQNEQLRKIPPYDIIWKIT